MLIVHQNFHYIQYSLYDSRQPKFFRVLLYVAHDICIYLPSSSKHRTDKGSTAFEMRGRYSLASSADLQHPKHFLCPRQLMLPYKVKTALLALKEFPIYSVKVKSAANASPLSVSNDLKICLQL